MFFNGLGNASQIAILSATPVTVSASLALLRIDPYREKRVI